MQVCGLISRRNRRNLRGIPTKASLHPALLWAYYQAMNWYNDVIPNPGLTTTCWLRLEFSWLQIQTSDDIFASCSWCSYSFGEVWLFKIKVDQQHLHDFKEKTEVYRLRLLLMLHQVGWMQIIMQNVRIVSLSWQMTRTRMIVNINM